MGSEQEAREAVELYGDTVRRICMLHLKSYHDTEDIFQTVFLKYMLHTGRFQDREHEKAWIIRVTLNACRDFLRSFFKCHLFRDGKRTGSGSGRAGASSWKISGLSADSGMGTGFCGGRGFFYDYAPADGVPGSADRGRKYK